MATQLKDVSTHALPYRHCTSADLFNVKGDVGDTAAFLAEADKYLSAFAAPVKDDQGKTACFHCGTSMDGMMHALGVGAAYVWGMCHGEATCSKCGWPARGMHYPKGEDGKELFSVRNLFLAYHPDQATAA